MKARQYYQMNQKKIKTNSGNPNDVPKNKVAMEPTYFSSISQIYLN